MIEINLIPEELRVKIKPKTVAGARGIEFKKQYLLYLIPITLSLLLCLHLCLAIVALTKGYHLRILSNKWQRFQPQRKTVEDFNKEYTKISADAQEIQELTRQSINWSEKLNKLSLLLPSGVWFNGISVTPGELTLEGSVVSLGREEINLIKKLIDNLKADAGFFKDFKSSELTSVQKKTVGGYDIADFILVGSLKPK